MVNSSEGVVWVIMLTMLPLPYEFFLNLGLVGLLGKPSLHGNEQRYSPSENSGTLCVLNSGGLRRKMVSAI